MDVRHALTHDLEKEFREEQARAERAVTGAIRTASDGLKRELRTQVQQAGLGSRLARTWQNKVYPSSGASTGAAATVYSKAPELMRVFAEGATIKSANGLWLAIPTAAAPRRGIGGKRISPSTFPEHSLGKLRFVYRRGKPSLLVVDGVRVGRSGKVRQPKSATTKSGRLRKGIATVVMFILVRQVRIRKRPVDLAFSADKWQGRVPTLIQIEFRKLDAQAGAA